MKLMLYLQGSVRDMADFDGSDGDQVDMVVTPTSAASRESKIIISVLRGMGNTFWW